MSRVLISGSFDPVTTGHFDLVKRSSELFDEVFVVAFINENKKYLFSDEDRVNMLKLAFEDIANVKVDFSDGLVVDYCKSKNVDFIVKGVRNSVDFEYENNMRQINMKLGNIETVLLCCEDGLEEISSTKVRELIEKKKPLNGLVPGKVEDYIKKTVAY